MSNENPFKNNPEVENIENNTGEKKKEGHKFTIMPNGTISEDITPEEYQDQIKEK